MVTSRQMNLNVSQPEYTVSLWSSESLPTLFPSSQRIYWPSSRISYMCIWTALTLRHLSRPWVSATSASADECIWTQLTLTRWPLLQLSAVSASANWVYLDTASKCTKHSQKALRRRRSRSNIFLLLHALSLLLRRQQCTLLLLAKTYSLKKIWVNELDSRYF